MHKTGITKATIKTGNGPLLVNTEGLKAEISAGRQTAVAIGNAAGARVQIGRRVLWNLEKVREYVNAISE